MPWRYNQDEPRGGVEAKHCGWRDLQEVIRAHCCLEREGGLLDLKEGGTVKVKWIVTRGREGEGDGG